MARVSDDDKGHSRSLVKAILLTLPMLLLTGFMLSGVGLPQERMQQVALTITYVFINGMFFLMMYTRRTNRYRSTLFVVYSLCFVISFISNLVETRGSMVLSHEDMVQGDTPFCHMVIPMVIIPAAFTRTIIFPGSMLEGFAAIGTMLVLWLGASIALGRAWCSWGCFYGGLDEGFSCIAKKPIIKNISKKWTYLPFAILLVIVLTSAASLSPTYCGWLCPFKAVTEFEEISSSTVLLQTIIFFSLFIGLVIILPILTKRRTQCGLFCPIGAFQSFTNKLNIFDVRIDPEKCSKCNLCSKVCPTFSVDSESIDAGKPRITCTKCGKCVDSCPKEAVSFHIKGTPIGLSHERARLLFVYPAFLFLSIMASGMVFGALERISLLVTTGSMIR
ncbi:MAG: 4Fe-4S dicluster domain-containing protein [Phycisphaerales bacterium]|nr:MAG: 4Fe-4S dicluster domain-containing protein [Phycisphaerales bacterium]